MLKAFAIPTLAVLITVGVVACPPPDTRAPVPPADHNVTPPAPNPTPEDPPPPRGDPKPEPESALAGSPCSTADDCQSGVCEGFGCDVKEGVCAPALRACTRDLRAYCDCNGATFQSSGSCPGRRYAYRGACEAPRADGAKCASDLQCKSGVCEGKGCGPEESGVCVSTGRACTADMSEFCGCDGETFRASGSCPGRRYLSSGPCR